LTLTTATAALTLTTATAALTLTTATAALTAFRAVSHHSFAKFFPLFILPLQFRDLLFGRQPEELGYFHIPPLLTFLPANFAQLTALRVGQFRVDLTELLAFLFERQVRISPDGLLVMCHLLKIREEEAVGDTAQHKQPRRHAQANKNPFPLRRRAEQQIVTDDEQQEHQDDAFACGRLFISRGRFFAWGRP
ncbi:MAG: hypothetical protein ACRELG_29535, partial [Gemmataceae bacterium]